MSLVVSNRTSLLFSADSLYSLLFSRTWQTSPFMEVEVAIRLLYMLGEALPASHGAHFSGDTAKTSALQDMMRMVSLITSMSGVCGVIFLWSFVFHVLGFCFFLMIETLAGLLWRQQLPAQLRVSGVL